jgi:predicted amidohydrolase YtcJ
MMNLQQPLSNPCSCCSPAIAWLVQAFLSRRQFMLTGISSFSAAISLAEPSQAAPKSEIPLGKGKLAIADKIYVNANVITVNDAQPSAEAVAIQEGKILAVGDRSTIEALKGPSTQIIDFQGKTVVPGFIDPHGHLFLQGVTAVVANLLPVPDGTVDSIAKLQEQLRAWAKTPVAKQLGWIIGNGYDDAQLQEQRHPTREDLDAVSTELPVLVIHQSGHLTALNSKALEMADITAATANPPGGVIRRQAGSNEPDGVLEENAGFLVFAALLKTTKIGSEDTLNLVREGAKLYTRYGFTTAQEGRASKAIYEILQAAAAKGSLPIDVAVYPDYMIHPDVHTWGMSRTYTNRVRLAGIKLNTDGSPQGRTAWLTQPYHQPPEGQPADYRGYGTLTDEQIIDRVESAYKHGIQAIIHGNGDASIDQIIMAVRKATEKYGKKERQTVLIHGQTVREDQLDEMKELGIFPALFPVHTFYWGDWHREVTLGPERAARISPMKSAIKRGMKVTIHADSPAVLPNSTRILWSAVNRRTRSNFQLGKDECLTPLEALKAMTIWSAYQHFEEDQKGSIEVGKLADFAVLSDNPLTVDPMKIQDIEVLETIKEGKTVYKA